MADVTFGGYTQGQNAGDKVPFEVLYDPMHLYMATQDMLFDRFASVKFVNALHSGVKEAFAFRYRNLVPATTPLQEGVLPTGSTVHREKVRWTFNQYGDYMPYTDVFDIFDVDKVTGEFLKVLSNQAAETNDVIIRDIISAGNRVIYAGGNTTRTDLQADGTAPLIAKKDIELAVLNLKNAKAKKFKKIITGSTNIGTLPIRDAYVGITHPNVINDLKDIEGWIPVEKYAYDKALLPNEVGSFGEVRFIEDTNALRVESTGENTVYVTLIFGQDAYAAVTPRGEGGTKTIHKPVTSGGVENALNQRGSIGWKMFAGAKILDQLHLIRIEGCASINVDNLIRYGDSTDVDAVTDESPISGI
jgi:N4-gp56 family major capsid protein